MILFFDTETSGKYDFKAPASAPHQPDLVQLAAMLCNEAGHVINQMNVIIEPVGWEIGAEAAAVHGITQEFAKKYGIPRRSALSTFNHIAKSAREIVAHNVKFDDGILESAFLRENAASRMNGRRVCTMLASTNLCQLPSNFKGGGYKWPKLEEVYQILFGEGFDGAHNAMADVSACARVYFQLKKVGLV